MIVGVHNTKEFLEQLNNYHFLRILCTQIQSVVSYILHQAFGVILSSHKYDL